MQVDTLSVDLILTRHAQDVRITVTRREAFVETLRVKQESPPRRSQSRKPLIGGNQPAHRTEDLRFPLSRRQLTPHLTTLHGRLDIPDLVPLYEEFSGAPVVPISTAQREPLPWLNWQGTGCHGLPEDMYRFREAPGIYLAVLGRISPEKRVDRAIEIAKQIGMQIRVAAKVDVIDRQYFEDVVAPRSKKRWSSM